MEIATGIGVPIAVVIVVVSLSLAAWFAAGLNGALTAHAEGRPTARGWSDPLADTTRLILQRRRTTLAADRPLWRIGGAGLVIVPLLMVAVTPVGEHSLFDSAVGVVWFNTADIAIWALVWLLGWGANSHYAIIAGHRFLAQALAYELPLMFALTAPAVAARSLRLSTMVDAQSGLWFVVWMPVAFLVVCVGIIGFSFWGPLGPAAGPDLTGGVLAELSGPDRLLVLAGRYLLLAAGSGFAVTLFLGGGNGPLFPPLVWLMIKTFALIAVLVALRRRLPLLRPERFTEIGWLILLPAALLQVLLVAVIGLVRG